MEEKEFHNLTQIGFDLELQRLNILIENCREKTKKLALSRAKLYGLARKLNLEIN